MMLRWLQKTGGKPIVLMGGGTTKVGDPSFRAEERPLLNDGADRREYRGDPSRRSAPYVKLLATGRPMPSWSTTRQWLDGLNYLGFLRDIGRHFSVNRMLSFESVKSRLDREQSLSLS